MKALLALTVFVAGIHTAQAAEPECRMIDKAPVVELLNEVPKDPLAIYKLRQILNWSTAANHACLQLEASDIPDSLLTSKDGGNALSSIATGARLVHSEGAMKKVLPLLESPNKWDRFSTVLFLTSGGPLESKELINAVLGRLYDRASVVAGAASDGFGYRPTSSVCPCSIETLVSLAQALVAAESADGHAIAWTLIPLQTSDPRILIPMAQYISLNMRAPRAYVSGIEGIIDMFIQNPPKDRSVAAELRKSLDLLRNDPEIHARALPLLDGKKLDELEAVLNRSIQ